jgi:hypothetical protein
MSLFYAMRPSDEPIGRDPTGSHVYQYTRYGRLYDRPGPARTAARRVGGRAYEYDGEHRLIYDAQQPSRPRPQHAYARPDTPQTWRELGAM